MPCWSRSGRRRRRASTSSPMASSRGQHFVHGFLERLEGIDFRQARDDRHSRRPVQGGGADGHRPHRARKGPVHLAEGALGRRANTQRRLKFTIPGPMTIVDTLADEHYRDRAARLAMEFARVINEGGAAPLAGAGARRAAARRAGPSTSTWTNVAAWGIEALEPRDRGADLHDRRAHLLRLRDPGQRRLEEDASGAEWRQVRAHPFRCSPGAGIDQVSLECANSRGPAPAPRATARQRTSWPASSTSPRARVEDGRGRWRKTIRAVMRHVDPARLLPCTNCGMVPLPRDVARAKLAALGAGARPSWRHEARAPHERAGGLVLRRRTRRCRSARRFARASTRFPYGSTCGRCSKTRRDVRPTASRARRWRAVTQPLPTIGPNEALGYVLYARPHVQHRVRRARRADLRLRHARSRPPRAGQRGRWSWSPPVGGRGSRARAG